MDTENWVAQAITNVCMFGTSTVCDSKADAKRYAKYYRSIGYHAKIYNTDNGDYDRAQADNYNRYKEQCYLQQQSIKYNN
jgi:hypothetical protein